MLVVVSAILSIPAGGPSVVLAETSARIVDKAAGLSAGKLDTFSMVDSHLFFQWSIPIYSSRPYPSPCLLGEARRWTKKRRAIKGTLFQPITMTICCPTSLLTLIGLGAFGAFLGLAWKKDSVTAYELANLALFVGVVGVVGVFLVTLLDDASAATVEEPEPVGEAKDRDVEPHKTPAPLGHSKRLMALKQDNAKLMKDLLKEKEKRELVMEDFLKEKEKRELVMKDLQLAEDELKQSYHELKQIDPAMSLPVWLL